MKKIFVVLICQLVLIGFVKSQIQKVSGYQYWFDNDYSNKTDSTLIVPVADFNLQTQIPTTGLSAGLHTFHIRFISNSNIWSGVISQFFQKLPDNSTLTNNKILFYEYWTDNNYSGKITVPVSAQKNYQLIDSISFSSLTNGLHTFHIRFKDEYGIWSAVQSQFFQKLPSGTNPSVNKMTTYEYWIDNNYAGKTYSGITPALSFHLIDSLSFASATIGLHTFHIRFKDESGQWSSILSQFFQKLPSQTSVNSKISAYEYWIDNDYSNKVLSGFAPIQNFQLIDSLAFSSITSGLHTFHIRFKDESGQWSSILSQFFQKLPSQSSVNSKMSAYEYWIDNDYSNKILSNFAPIQNFQLLDSLPFSSVTNGLHTFHIRFKDESGQWGIILSQFFQKLPSVISNIPNLVTAYKYWIDMSDTTVKNVKLSSPVSPYNLLTLLDLIDIPKGNHEIHFQFSDTLKQWSSVLTDTFYKYPTVIANFTASNLFLCDSGWVHFTNNSFDADTFHWIFDDGTISNLFNPSHYFNTYGIHPVVLVATDTTQGVIDTLTANIKVVYSPSVFLGTDTTVCGGVLLNAWNANSTYHWSDATTDSILSVSNSGIFSVTVTNQWSCSDNDSIHVIVNPNPVVNLGHDTIICANTSLVLDAGSGFNQYNWNTGPFTQTIIVNSAGTYIVDVTDSNGCHGMDTINVTLDPCTNVSDIFENFMVTIYPNPNNGDYYIKVLNGSDEEFKITVMDMSGRPVFYQENVSLANGSILPVNNTSYPCGIYMLYITSNSVRIVQKIVINRK